MFRIYAVRAGVFALLISMSFRALSVPETESQSGEELLNQASPALASLIERVWETHPAAQAAEDALQAPKVP